MTIPRPPRLAERLVGALVAPEHREALLDDLREEYAARCAAEGGPRRAGLWYWGEAGRSVAPALTWRWRRRVRGTARGGGAMRGWRADVRQAMRGLARDPVYAVTAIAALGLGIGATTALASVVQAVLLRPLPYPEPERVVRVHNHWEGQHDGNLSPAEYFDYLDQTREVFEAFGSYAYGAANVAGEGGADRLTAAYVTAGVLQALGASPQIGRALREDDDPLGPGVVLLSDALWASRFGRSPGVLGRVLQIDAVPCEVIGVLPPGWRLPDDLGEDPAQLVLPLPIDRASVVERGSHFLDGVARLRDGVPPETAQAALEAVAARFVADHPDDYPREMRFGVRLADAHEDAVAPVRPTLIAILSAVVLVLLVACANVASLALTRAEGRRRDLAVRAALGATRWRLARQLLVESLAVSAAGGAAGLALAWAGLALLRRTPPDLPRVSEVSIDPSALAVAGGLALATGVLLGLLPLAGAGRSAALRDGGRGASAGRRAAAVRRGLVAVELALAVVLLAGAGVLLRSTRALLRVEPGYDPHHVLTTRVLLPEATYPEDGQRRAFFDRLAEAVAALPGVEGTAVASHTPLAQGHGDIGVELEGREKRPGEASIALDWTVVGPGYFEVLRQPLLAGRPIDDRDGPDAPGAVVLNLSAARKLYGGGDALGRRFLLGGGTGPGWVSVVGVAADSRQEALGEPARPMMYLAHRQFRFWHGGGALSSASLFVRSGRDAAELVTAVRAEVARLDAGVPAADFATLEEVVAASLSRQRFVLGLLAGFAGLALLLAAIGTYGVVGWSVAQRTREIGVRMAFGASAGRVFREVMGQTLATAGLGLAAGLAAAAAFTPRLRALLYEVAPLDPASLALAGGLLLAVALLASLTPALRATRVDPAVSLRSE